MLDPGLSFDDEVDVSFVRSGVKGPDGHHDQWVEEIRFEANALFEGIALLDAGLRIGITPEHDVSSIRVTRIEIEPLDTVAVEASEADLRDSFAEHVVGTRSGPMEWREIDPPIVIEGLPAPGETRLTVTVHEPSMAEQLETRRRRSSSHDRMICNEVALFAELEIELHSDDGLLDARIPAQVTFFDPLVASIFAPNIEEQELGGLELMPSEPGTECRSTSRMLGTRIQPQAPAP